MTKTDELAITKGLNIREYPTKWAQAKEMALTTDKETYSESNAYELACRFFVELGGGTGKDYYGFEEVF